MRLLLAAFSGFALTIGIFLGGAALAVTYLSAEPVQVQRPMLDAASIFPNEVVRVDPQNQEYERIGPVPVQAAFDTDALGADENDAGVDEMITAALPSDVAQTGLNPAHVAWCKQRYRSYDADRNTYRPYSGGTRECISPYLDDLVVDSGAGYEEALLEEASAETSFFAQAPDPVHIERCFARYRSYRPEDNSYQPFGGGPRAQCEL